MHNSPNVAELLTSVKAFIKETAAPHLSGQAAFHARVAANALDLVLRDLSARADMEHWQVEQLQSLLGRDTENLEALTTDLCERLRSGDMTWTTPGLAVYLSQAARRQLAVDQPRYSGYRTALERTDNSSQ